VLVQPHRHSDYGEMRIDADAWNKCHFRLWYPGHVEHMRAIVGPPVEPGLMWLERKKAGEFIWQRCRRMPDGTALLLDTIDLSKEHLVSTGEVIHYDATTDKWKEGPSDDMQ
jgi:hypothetical protein